MRTLCAYVTALVLFAGLGLRAEDTFTFNVEVPKAGATRTEVADLSLDMKIDASVGGKVVNSQTMAQKEHKKFKSTVLELTENEPSKVRVEFEEYKADDGAPAGAPAPELNKAYVVERKDGKVSVAAEKGGDLSEAEKAFLDKEFKRFGKSDSFAKFLNGKALKAGEKLKISEEDARTLFDMSGEEGMKLDECSLVFKGLEKFEAGEAAVFESKLLISKVDEGGLKMNMEITGPIAVDPKTCWPVSMKIGGPIVIGGAMKKGEITIDMGGGGAMKMTRAATYTQP
ncbi:MAG: hypothetical protein KIS92_01170 [Planctomycetota bacterium]|nr:hypothetical protein [Planctomycetota bacterium]